jgi:outer membrane protein OmpA-like peptidoglycan-associated protein
LVSAGVEEARMIAVGFGAESPIVPNDTTEGRAQNRRVVFEIVDQVQPQATR